MVQHKPKPSASKDTSSHPGESSTTTPSPATSSTTNLTTAPTILDKLNRQDGGFYLATQNLASKVEYFQGGHEGDVLIQKHTAGSNELTLCTVFQISQSDFYFTPDAKFDPANVFNGRFADVKLSCHLTATRHHDFSFSSDDFPTVINNLQGFEKLIRREHDAESLSAVHTAVGVESVKLVHHLFTLKPTKSTDDELIADIADDATSSETATSLGSEFDLLNWPVVDRCKAELTNLTETHIINPLPAYRTDCKLIPPAQYEAKLCGAVVEVHFAFFHHHIRRSKRHIFNTVLHEMIMLQPPSNMPSSPLKRRKLGAGPSLDIPFKGKKHVHISSNN